MAIKTLIKASVVATSVLLGITATGTKIAIDNEEGINNALGIGASITGDSRYETVRDLQNDSKKLAKEIEGEGIVLLQNKNNALPLAKDSKVSLFGYASVVPYYGGRGSSSSGSLDANVDPKTGLTNAGLQVNPTIDSYMNGLTSSGISYKFAAYDVPWSKADADSSYTGMKFIKDDKELLDSVSTYGDAAIFTIARSGGEAGDISIKYNEDGSIKEDKLALTDNEKSILKGLTQLKKDKKIKNIIVLMNSTNQIQQKEFEQEGIDVDAILWIGHTGINGFEAVGDVLVGTTNPSGHLMDTFWYNHQDNPVMKNFGAYKYTNRDDYEGVMPSKSKRSDPFGTYVAYQEGIYLGYRYTETRYTDVVNGVEGAEPFDYASTVYRPFGFGMSYTDFKFENLSINQNGDQYIAKVKVTNTGDVAGKAVAQAYVSKPFNADDKERHIEKAAVELVGFEKTKLLEPGDSETVAIVIDERDFASYDKEYAKTYVLSAGDYLLTVAKDAHEAANNFLAHNGKNDSPKMTAKGNADFVKSFTYEYDATTYATSKNTGKEIKNLFDISDINKNPNKGDNKLEFLSRTNWSKTLDNKLSLNDNMVNFILGQQNTSKIQKQEGAYPTYDKLAKTGDDGQPKAMQLVELLMDSHGEEYAYDDPMWEKFLDQLTWDETAELVTKGLRMTAGVERLGKPQTLDHNGPCGLTNPYSKGNGLAKKDPNLDPNLTPIAYPTVPVLASTFNKELAARFGDMLGEDALWAGYSGFYGVALNSHRSPYGGRHFEYWSEDPFLAGKMATEQVKTLQKRGVMAYIKHFALNDQETQRFGVQVWSNEQALREISLKPFEYAVIDGNAMSAMASFSRIGMEFAPASHALITEFLKEELGMKGLVVTDMYSLGYLPEQYVNFLMAGTDIPDEGLSTTVFNDFKEGYPQVAARMRDAAHRVMYHTLKSNAMYGKDADTILKKVVPSWKIGVIAGTTTVSVLCGASLVWAIVATILDKKKRLTK